MTTETPRVRTSDAERERIAQTLRAAVGEGRLTLEEGDERLATLYKTKYRDELGSLVADLPGGVDDGTRRGPGRRHGGGNGGPDEVWTPDSDTDEAGNPRGYGPGWTGYSGQHGPGWAGQQWGGPQSGGPQWGGPGWDRRGRRPGPPWFLLPLLPIFLLFLVFGAIGGIVHGHFFAIIPLVLVVFAMSRLARFGHRWGGWRR